MFNILYIISLWIKFLSSQNFNLPAMAKCTLDSSKEVIEYEEIKPNPLDKIELPRRDIFVVVPKATETEFIR